jgi:hypothetical protein
LWSEFLHIGSSNREAIALTDVVSRAQDPQL